MNFLVISFFLNKLDIFLNNILYTLFKLISSIKLISKAIFEIVRSLSFNSIFFFSSRRRHTRSYGDWSSDVCSSDLESTSGRRPAAGAARSALPDVLSQSRRTAPPRTGAAAPLQSAARLLRSRRSREARSEERRVGKEWRSLWWPQQYTRGEHKRRGS